MPKGQSTVGHLAVSVIIPTHNRAHLIGRAISSALAEVQEEDEILVVDDGSTDGTQDVVRSFGRRVRYLRTEHRGAGAARNHGLQAAGNGLVAFLDSDDEWLPGKLELERAVLEARSDLVFCCTDFVIRTGEQVRRCGLISWQERRQEWHSLFGPGTPVTCFGAVPRQFREAIVYSGDFYLPLMADCCVCTITLVVRRDAAGDALRFPEDLPLLEDWECYARVAGRGLGALIDCETAVNYGHIEERLTDAGMLERTDARLTMLRRVWGSDEELLATHRDSYLHIVEHQRILRAKALLVAGRTREAALELRSLPQAPVTYRLLATLPGPLASGALELRRSVKSALGL